MVKIRTTKKCGELSRSEEIVIRMFKQFKEQFASRGGDGGSSDLGSLIHSFCVAFPTNELWYTRFKDRTLRKHLGIPVDESAPYLNDLTTMTSNYFTGEQAGGLVSKRDHMIVYLHEVVGIPYTSICKLTRRWAQEEGDGIPASLLEYINRSDGRPYVDHIPTGSFYLFPSINGGHLSYKSVQRICRRSVTKRMKKLMATDALQQTEPSPPPSPSDD